RAFRRMQVEVAATSYGPLAPDVEGSERVHLPSVWNANNHSELLLRGRIRRGRLHASEFKGRSFVLVEVRQYSRSLYRCGGKYDGLLRADWACSRRHRSAVLRHQHAAYAIIGTDALDVVLNDLETGDLAGFDRPVQLVDRSLFQAKALFWWIGLLHHGFVKRLST